MELDLSEIARHPEVATHTFELADGELLLLRPLEAKDVDSLTEFLANLSPETRRLSTFEGYGSQAAQALVDAINKYDKLRLVIRNDQDRLVGLMELSFGLPANDVARYASYGTRLDEATDCRFGPTLSDDYQGKGVGNRVFPLVTDIVKGFGKSRIILWGGVLVDNEKAIHFYERLGFKQAGNFEDRDSEKKDMIFHLVQGS